MQSALSKSSTLQSNDQFYSQETYQSESASIHSHTSNTPRNMGNSATTAGGAPTVGNISPAEVSLLPEEEEKIAECMREL